MQQTSVCDEKAATNSERHIARNRACTLLPAGFILLATADVSAGLHSTAGRHQTGRTMPIIILFLFTLVLPSAAALAEPEKVNRALDCYCTDSNGQRVELGQVTCLFVDGRAFMAKCDMSLNNPTWRETGDDCILAYRRTETSVGELLGTLPDS